MQQTINWWYFFLFFPENRIWHFMQIVWNVETCFLRKVRKIFQYVDGLLKILPSAKCYRLNVQKDESKTNIL